MSVPFVASTLLYHGQQSNISIVREVDPHRIRGVADHRIRGVADSDRTLGIGRSTASSPLRQRRLAMELNGARSNPQEA